MEGNKSKKTIDELIQHMDNKGIKFDLISKSEAMEFLENNNYYMKLSSYRINFEKYEPNSLKAGQYINLDFGHLKELSTLDRHLRYLLLQMCMDIEHYMKTKLITHVSKNEDEDGYDIIKQFLNKKGKIE